MSNDVENELDIKVTQEAMAHFKELIAKEEVEGMGLRVYVDLPGSPMAQINITFCPPGDVRETDVKFEVEGIKFFFDKKSIPLLKEMKIGFENNETGGQLLVSAPNLKGTPPAEDAPLADKIKYVIETEINPALAGHGGMISLVEVTQENNVVLRFGGGCKGCAMANVTLQDGIEARLRELFPEIKGIQDATAHDQGENPFYRE